MARVTKQTIDTAWRNRFAGGDRHIKIPQVPGLELIHLR